jgi:hypothetical protein
MMQALAVNSASGPTFSDSQVQAIAVHRHHDELNPE